MHCDYKLQKLSKFCFLQKLILVLERKDPSLFHYPANLIGNIGNSATIRFDYRDELVGNFVRGSLHGGVVSATLDLTGGLVAFLSALKSMEGRSEREKTERLANVGTIDLRVDYLRPGIGKHFVASGSILRAGNKVAVTRMELHNEDDAHIAVGTGAYLVG